MSEVSSDSEECPSFVTESESEHDSTWGEDKEPKEVDYTATAKDIICENVNITTENALKLNSGYHNMLKVLKNKLEILLAQCQERQVEIEKQIEEYRTAKRPLTGKSRTSGYICGQPFFKDEDLYPGPHNDDYLHRKNARREFFPLDMFEATDTNWTTKDKVNILKGVKTQIVEFIERENRLKIKKIGNGLEAERLRRETASLNKKEIGELWEKVKHFASEYPGQKFEIDWLRISNINISERHSVSACIGIWNNYMLPGLVRDAWKVEEESPLLESVKRHNGQNWQRIAMGVPGRSAYQCFVHYQTTFSDLAQIKHDRWTTEEDVLLVSLVEANRVGSNIVWNKVVEKMPLRNKIQCYNRYMFTLMRPTKNAKFTPEEDCIITAYVQEHGEDFKYVPSGMLPGRTNRQIWARYHHTLKYVNKHAGWSIEEDIRLMNYIKENLTDEGPRKISWAACSKVLGNHSRLSCRTRYYTIEKFLEKHPDATLDDVPRKEKRLSTYVTKENWVTTIVDIRNERKSDTDDMEHPSTSTAPQKAAKKKAKTYQRFDETSRCAIKKKFYDKLKYSFHYRFGDQFASIDNPRVFCTHKAICLLLGGKIDHGQLRDVSEHFTSHEIRFLRLSLSMKMNPRLVNFLKNCRTSFLLPPSYTTMLGLRGVVLNATFPNEPTITSEPKVGPLDEVAFNNALQNFRQRFRMVFYWTMLLARQNPREADFQSSESVRESYTLLEPGSEHDYVQALRQDYGRYYEEQVSLQQLEELCNTPRQQRLPPPPPPEPEPTAVCLEQLGLEESTPLSTQAQEEVTSVADFHIPSEVSHPVLVEAHAPSVAEAPSEEHPSLPDSQSGGTGVVIMPRQLPLPERLQPTQICAPIAIPHTFTYPLFDGCETSSNQLDLVAQITIINPDDLPVVQAPVMLPIHVSVAPMTEKTGEVVASTAELGIGQEEQEPAVEQAESDMSDSDNESIRDDHSSGNESGESSVHQVSLESQSFVAEPHQQFVTPAVQVDTALQPFEPLAVAVDNEEPPEPENDLEIENLPLSSTSLAHVTHVINVGDFVIEELEEANCSGSPEREKARTDPDIASPLEATSATTLPSSDIPSDSCEEKAEAEIEESVDAEITAVTNSSSENGATVTQNEADEAEPDWNTEQLRAPRRTYSRARRSSPNCNDNSADSAMVESHAWRWTHLDEAKSDEIEEHRYQWELCDPCRTQFRVVQQVSSLDETDLDLLVRNPVIIIDDEEIEIKEEPLDDEEIAAPDDPLVEEQVDESTIQQIIQTASNIFKISQMNKLSASGVSEPAQPPMPPPLPPVPLSGRIPITEPDSSLIVQTPSRIFDEESNCYYFVDEVNEDSIGNFFPMVPPLFNSSSSSVTGTSLESIVQRSLQNTYPVMPQFKTPQRVPTPNHEPFQPIPITRTPHRTPSTYGRRRISIDRRSIPESVKTSSSPPSPTFGKPKRPPRNEQPNRSPEERKGSELKALSQLAKVYRQPRLLPVFPVPPNPTTVEEPPSKRQPSGVNALAPKNPPLRQHQPQPVIVPKVSLLPNPALATTSSAGNVSKSKRLHPRKHPPAPNPKRVRIENTNETVIIEDLPREVEDDHDVGEDALQPISSGVALTFNAVDIIDALTSMNKFVKLEENDDSASAEEDTGAQGGFDPDDEADFLAHLEQQDERKKEAEKATASARPPPLRVISAARPNPPSKPTIQQMVNTIVESSVGRPLLDVQFKVADLTITKVKHK